jgi:hypothetical protein
MGCPETIAQAEPPATTPQSPDWVAQLDTRAWMRHLREWPPWRPRLVDESFSVLLYIINPKEEAVIDVVIKAGSCLYKIS